MNRTLRRGLAYTGIAAMLIGGYFGLTGGCNRDNPHETSPIQRKTSVRTVENPGEIWRVHDVYGSKLTEDERLLGSTYVWKPGAQTAAPSGNRPVHKEHAKFLDYKQTYADAGYHLGKLQNIVLVDARRPDKHIVGGEFYADGDPNTISTLHIGLMPDCADALYKMNEELKRTHDIDLINGIMRDFSPSDPTNLYRSFFGQINTWERMEGPWDPSQRRLSNKAAWPGFGNHGTGNAVDMPYIETLPAIWKDEYTLQPWFVNLVESYGFNHRLPGSDERHFEYTQGRLFPLPIELQKKEENPVLRNVLENARI